MGIDYGMGKTNINHETGIRYGVIAARELGQSWYESAEYHYGREVEEHDCDGMGACKDSCIHEEAEAISASVDADGLKAEESVGSFATSDDIFITESPYFTYGPFCSPCAPGAISLPTNIAGESLNDAKAYCFGHDWFEDGKAPYPVYSITTGKIVNG